MNRAKGFAIALAAVVASGCSDAHASRSAASPTPATTASVAPDPSTREALRTCARLLPLMKQYKTAYDDHDQAAVSKLLPSVARLMPSPLPSNPQSYSNALEVIQDELAKLKSAVATHDDSKAFQQLFGMYYTTDELDAACSALQ